MKDWKIVTKKKPTEKELISMDFAVRCVKHIKSNSVVFVKDTHTVGIGGGQTARVDATWIATHKGKDNIKGKNEIFKKVYKHSGFNFSKIYKDYLNYGKILSNDLKESPHDIDEQGLLARYVLQI
jgi:AICAR transformylase/IMP cyclohydrolase PurH